MAVVRAQEASSSTFRYAYHVFLSFRGEDTRKTFTDHLYSALVQTGFRTFRDDDEIERGKRLELELRKAMQQSRISISLVMILKWSRSRSGHEVLLVFYDLDPSDFRNQKGSIREAFARYEKELVDAEIDDKKKKEWMEKLKGWKVALEEVANLTEMILENQANGFEGYTFLASVREESKRSNGLVNLQMQLLSTILKGKKEEIYNVDEGIIKINEAICCKKVLVVIDDVDEVKQLEALLGTREFHPGSKIIITTRNKSLLRAHEVYKLHIVENLSLYESLELFCWHAFGKEHPDKGYEEQSERAVYHCGGLPLACEILGSSLAGKSTEVWASTLEKLEAIPETKILNSLKISFDSLQDDNDKNLFLHIACFFVGHNKDETIEILDKCDFFTVCGIQNLVDRCFISINECNKLMMHQLLQEMGWQIVDQELPKEPWRRSRLWRLKDSFIVLKGKKGTETIEGLVLDMQMYKDDAFNVTIGKKGSYYETCDTIFPSNYGSSFRRRYFNFLSAEPSIDVSFNYDAFSRMDKLKLLKLNYAKLSGRCEKFPEGLRWLCWHGFPLKFIPSDLPLGNLVSLDMSYSKLKHVWAGNKVLLSLKILNFSHSQRLVKTPNFIGLPNLERLILRGCASLVEVCDTIANLGRLALLNLENCKSLRNFPNVGMLNSLQTLVLDGCLNIIGESSKVVGSNGITVNPLPSTRRDLINLWHTLFLPRVLKPILTNPEHICVSLPRSLVSLSLQNCNLSDDDFPLDFSNLSMLAELDLSCNHFRNLPHCIGNLRNLGILKLNSCKELHSVSGLPNLEHLQVIGCRSLESIINQSALSKPFIMLSSGIGKLKEIQGMFKFEPMEKVDREMLNKLGLCSAELIRNLKLNFVYNSMYGYKVSEDIRQVHSLFLSLSIYICICKHIAIVFPDFVVQRVVQGFYEFGIFSTFLQREEIPSWCGDRNNKGSSSISFVVPSQPSLRITGLNVYSVYTLSNSNTDEIGCSHILFTKISNKTKDLKWIYTPVAIAIPKKKNEDEDQLVWLSHWKFENHLESGDEVDISVIAGEALKLKEFGINLVWGEEEKGQIKAIHCHHHNNAGEVIGGDLSNYQFMSRRHFFLCHHYMHPYFTKISIGMFREVFGDHVTYEGVYLIFKDGGMLKAPGLWNAVNWTNAKSLNNFLQLRSTLAYQWELQRQTRTEKLK
ncbi:hypothetical protein LguiA_025474 [Lonicera macranthoides]